MNSDQPEINHRSEASEKSITKYILREFWTLFFIRSVVAFTVSGLMLNMLGISKIIWPYDPFHSIELGLITGLKTIAVAICGLIFGFFGDKVSRRKLMIFVLFFMAFGRILNGFVPTDDLNTFVLFLACYIILGIGQGGIQPLIFSISSDSIEFNARSRFFGIVQVYRQTFATIGMVTSAFLIQIGHWRIYYWVTGISLFICGIFMIFFLKEPKRGMMHQELTDVLSIENAKYDYKLNKETIRTTIFAPTNIIAFVEGIFTWILFSISIYMIYPYIQSPPYNVSPVNSSLLMIIWGIPGGIVGSISFSKLSDKLAEKNIMWRIYLIVSSLIFLFFLIFVIFFIPLPTLSFFEGNNITDFVLHPIFLIFGGLVFLLRAVLVIYNINQPPILQAINLPEAQSKISSWNQFLEFLGLGVGPIISGFLLAINNQNYTSTAIITIILGIPSMFLWLLANRWIKKDINRVNSILKERASEISQKL